MKEKWLPIDNYEGLYLISNYGKVKSLISWNGHEYKKKKEF